jgi:phosphoadenosine phosphosulfate reductase
VLFLNELLRTDGDNAALEAWCGARAYTHEQLETMAGCFGLVLDYVAEPTYVDTYLRGLSLDVAGYDAAFHGVRPRLWRFIRQDVLPVAAKVGSALGRHDKIALQVSGGKDSLALLYLLMPWWKRLCVYWLNTGDAYPEMIERMARIRAEVPYFREINGCQPEIVAADGWPSDVVPHQHTTLGNLVFGATSFKVQSRLDCCWRALMLPLHQALVADGVTLAIRGKRADEADKTGLQSGYIDENGIELLFPILDWSADEVFAFLADNDIEAPPFYSHANSSLDCMSCTAWLEHKNGAYLAAHYPDRHTEHRRRLELIRDAVIDQMKGF